LLDEVIINRHHGYFPEGMFAGKFKVEDIDRWIRTLVIYIGATYFLSQEDMNKSFPIISFHNRIENEHKMIVINWLVDYIKERGLSFEDELVKAIRYSYRCIDWEIPKGRAIRFIFLAPLVTKKDARYYPYFI